MIDPWLASMRAAQFKLIEELQSRGWPQVEYAEVYSYPDTTYRSFLAVVDLVGGAKIQVGFVLPFGVDPMDDDKMIRLTKLFFRDCRISAPVAS